MELFLAKDLAAMLNARHLYSDEQMKRAAENLTRWGAAGEKVGPLGRHYLDDLYAMNLAELEAARKKPNDG